MAILKSVGQGGPQTALPPPPLPAEGRLVEVRGQGSLLSGRREREVAIEATGFASLRMRIAVALSPGSWVELRLQEPFPDETHVAGLVGSCTPSAQDKQSEFRVELGLHSADEGFLGAVDGLLAVSEQDIPPRIVYADGDPLGRTAIAAALRGTGSLLEAEDRAGISRHLLASPPPEVLVLASRLPDADGIALVRLLSEQGWLLPTVILSNRYPMDASRALRELGRQLYQLLEKPAGREQMRGVVADLVGRGRAAARARERERARVELYRRLRESHAHLRRAVGRHLNTRIIDGGPSTTNENQENKTKEITILFADIRNSTAIVDRLPAEQAVAIVNRVLTELSEAVETHGGTVDKFLGDGLMGLFGAGGEDRYHRHRSLAAARAMVNRIRALNQGRAFPEGIEIGIGIGIQSGSCILGNVGSEYRKEFTALGAPVNVAARLQNLAGPNRIVLPATLAAALEDVAQFESMGQHELKGFEKPVEVVRVRE